MTALDPSGCTPGGSAGHAVRTSILDANWAAPPGIRALTTLRSPAGASSAPFDRFNLGDHCGDVPANVFANREALRTGLDLPEPPRWLRQVHGTAVVRFDASSARKLAEADAAVTSTRGIVLALLTADCLPVVLAARDGSEVGVAHAGWRGLADGVIEATVGAMCTAPSKLAAWLGPAAGPARYEIGAEVYQAFVDRDPDARVAFAATRPGHWTLDLHAVARLRLEALGLTLIAEDGSCTIADAGRFFSYRRDGACGRMATLAWIEPAA